MTETLHTHIEDAHKAARSVADLDEVLDDDQLQSGGLVPIKAWVRSKASSNALRAKRSREKAEQGEGGDARKQVSLLAPPDEASRAALRELGRRMVTGEISVQDLDRITAEAVPIDENAARLGRQVQGLIDKGGLRSRILKYLIHYRV